MDKPFTLEVSAQEFQLLWSCLAEQPAKVVFPLMVKLQAQVHVQELAATSTLEQA